MFKFLVPVVGIFVFVGMSFLQRSVLPDHNVFITNNANLYDDMKNDKSFGQATAFFVVDKIFSIKRRVHKGEYFIAHGESAYSLLGKMIRGDTVTRKITIPEGYTVKMVIEKLNNDENLSGNIEEIPEEGSLFPSTYFYKKNDTRISIIQKMRTQMNMLISKLLKNQSVEKIKEVMIISSIIEKETRNSEERSLIASVFKNRLEKNMRLQSDPTVIYAMSDGYGKIDHLLTRKDLFYQSPYNTYRNSGLPPTPICCPSKESIIAVLNPASTDYLYFVATPDNQGHVFTKEYKEHLKNVRQRKVPPQN